jgi:hypothetical protein
MKSSRASSPAIAEAVRVFLEALLLAPYRSTLGYVRHSHPGLVPATGWVEPGSVAKVPKRFQRFDMAICEAVGASCVMAKVRAAPIGIIARYTAGTISNRDISEHPGAKFGRGGRSHSRVFADTGPSSRVGEVNGPCGIDDGAFGFLMIADILAELAPELVVHGVISRGRNAHRNSVPLIEVQGLAGAAWAKKNIRAAQVGLKNLKPGK